MSERTHAYVCTVSDINYLPKGLALYSSLCMTEGRNFSLFWLCLDNFVYLELEKLKLENVKTFLLPAAGQVELIHARLLPKSNYGDEEANFIWRIIPWFVRRTLVNEVPAGEKLVYADADIFFYRPPSIITCYLLGSKAVGIHTHRFQGPYDPDKDTGWYNVGVMVFTNNEVGYIIADAWKNWVFESKSPLYEKYSTCGDQRWLNLFIPAFGKDNICVFDESPGYTHLAPWNVDNLEFPIHQDGQLHVV
ncbi:MAG TPA: hypothetical protein VFV08_17045, partial [Puia sp.]|nr:hypothetical protein [Puia sp.]